MPGSLGSHIHRLREVEAEHLQCRHSRVVDFISGWTAQLEDALVQSSQGFTKSLGLDHVQGCNYQVVWSQIGPVCHTESGPDKCKMQFVFYAHMAQRSKATVAFQNSLVLRSKGV